MPHTCCGREFQWQHHWSPHQAPEINQCHVAGRPRSTWRTSIIIRKKEYESFRISVNTYAIYNIDTVSFTFLEMMGAECIVRHIDITLFLFFLTVHSAFPSIPASTRDAQLEDWSCCPLDHLGSQRRNHQSSTPAERSYLGRCCEP